MATPDPNSPGYRPDAHTDRNLGDVGSGYGVRTGSLRLVLPRAGALPRPCRVVLGHGPGGGTGEREPGQGTERDRSTARRTRTWSTSTASCSSRSTRPGRRTPRSAPRWSPSSTTSWPRTSAARDAFNQEYSKVPGTRRGDGGARRLRPPGDAVRPTAINPAPRIDTGHTDSDPRTRTGGPQE